MLLIKKIYNRIKYLKHNNYKMGQKQLNVKSVIKKPEEKGNIIINICIVVGKENFDFIYVVGKGGFGKVYIYFNIKLKVWKVFHKKNKKLFALKEMSKAKIIDKKSQISIKYERDLLTKITHP